MKFGGTSVGSPEAFIRVAELVARQRAENQTVVVVSAMAGVTDQLLTMARDAARSTWSRVEEALGELRSRHLEVAQKAIAGRDLQEEASRRVAELTGELEKVLTGIAILREQTPRSTDLVLSFGERLSAPLLTCVLRDRGIEARDFTGGEVGIVTDDHFGEASPLMNVTAMKVKRNLEPLLDQGVIPVVTGFIAATQYGDITTLGRGGSDYTATILGAALEADEVWIWSDVDGIMTADPKLVPEARVIEELSYEEAMEMAMFGAKAMHPRALEPASEHAIPVRVKNTFNPEGKGTLISSRPPRRARAVVKSVAAVRGVAMINVAGASMVGLPGTAAKVFQVLGKNGINILMISQSVTEASITMVVRRETLQKAVSALEMDLVGGGVVREVTADEDVGVVAALGAGMKGTPGVAARIFKAVAERGINVKMIAQGSSELNISFAVNEGDVVEAVRAIHEEFELDKGF
jgi:aspartate kinase